MGCRRHSFKSKIVLEISEDRILEHDVGHLLLNYERAVVNNKLSSLMSLNNNLIRCNVNLVVRKLELLLCDLDVVVCWIFNRDDRLRTFSNRADKLELFDVFTLFNCYRELVENKLTRSLLFEGSSKLVNANFHREEVQLVLFDRFACNVKRIGATNE